MDKFWESYIQSRPAPGSSKGAFDAFAAAHRDPGPRTMAQGGGMMGQLVTPSVDGSRPGYAEKKLTKEEIDNLVSTRNERRKLYVENDLTIEGKAMTRKRKSVIDEDLFKRIDDIVAEATEEGIV